MLRAPVARSRGVLSSMHSAAAYGPRCPNADMGRRTPNVDTAHNLCPLETVESANRKEVAMPAIERPARINMVYLGKTLTFFPPRLRIRYGGSGGRGYMPIWYELVRARLSIHPRLIRSHSNRNYKVFWYRELLRYGL